MGLIPFCVLLGEGNQWSLCPVIARVRTKTLCNARFARGMPAACTYFKDHFSCQGTSQRADFSWFRTVESVTEVHKVNVVGPMMVTQAMLPLLRKGRKKLVRRCHADCTQLLVRLAQTLAHTLACRAA